MMMCLNSEQINLFDPSIQKITNGQLRFQQIKCIYQNIVFSIQRILNLSNEEKIDMQFNGIQPQKDKQYDINKIIIDNCNQYKYLYVANSIEHGYYIQLYRNYYNFLNSFYKVVLYTCHILQKWVHQYMKSTYLLQFIAQNFQVERPWIFKYCWVREQFYHRCCIFFYFIWNKDFFLAFQKNK